GPYPRRAQGGIARGQLVAGGRQQGHVGDRGRERRDRRPGRRAGSGYGRPGAESDTMLSRVAESIYWMSRYIERADNVARFVDVTLNLILDMPVGSVQQWQPLVDTTGDAAAFAKRYGTATQQRVIQFLTFDQDNPSSILSCLRAARENARSVREIISSDMWEQVNNFYLRVIAAAGDGRSLREPHQFFASVKLSSHSFAGVTDATMTHNEAWHFCGLGRQLERADKTSRILDVKYFLLLPNAADV